MAKNWLVKSEPNVYSIDDLKKDKKTLWDAVRNYQARNFLKSMCVGDRCFIYHSNAKPPGIAGVAKVSKINIADPLQFDKKSHYYDEKATKENPRWFSPEVKFVKKFKELISLEQLREEKKLKDMVILRKGNRLSVTEVSDKEFEHILKIANA